MPTRSLTVTFDAHDPAVLGRFWGGLLGRDAVRGDRGVLLPGDDTQLSLRFAPSRTVKSGPNRMHLHLTSSGDAGQHEIVAAALRLGAAHLDVGQLPGERHIVLADPEGNEFCVIESDNGWLAGCGPLGEIACDGSRDVGLFYSRATGWPLVWDQDEETAIQLPRGGTKVAWGGPPVHAKPGRTRQRLDISPADGDQRAEVDRLIALGATRLRDHPDGTVELADPDGNDFRVAPD
jgi:hypothetical protein